MGRPSTIDRLPPEVRALIGKLRRDGRTIDEVLGKLHELDIPDAKDVSRSALGRHVKQLDAVAAEIQRTRAVANAIVDKFGDAPESKTARLNIELMHSVVMKLLVPEDDNVQLSSQDAYFLGTALQRLSQAQKIDVDREVKIRDQVKREMAEKTQAAAKQASGEMKKAGISDETIRKIETEILGIVRA